MKLFLFDVDQTLISTGGAGIRALNRACRQIFSIDNAMDGILPHGKTDPSIIREIFAARSLDERQVSLNTIIDLYLTFLGDEVQASPSYRVLPGIVDIIYLLEQTDTLLGLATGNVESGARIKLERGGLNRHFAFGGFGSDSENRAALVRRAAEVAAERSGAELRPDDIFVIGDTPYDIAAGREAGFRTVGVATGRFSVVELDGAGASFSISDFSQERDRFLRAVGR